MRHPGVQDALSFSKIFLRDFWGAPLGAPGSVGTWRPVVTLSFWIDRHAFGGGPAAFHATNVAAFALLVVACDRFLRRFAGASLSAPARLFAVALFAAATVHVDVVPSLVGRTEIFAMLFSLVALHVALEPKKRPRHHAIVAAALLAAMWSKESTLPIALLAAFLPLRREGAGRLASVAVPVGTLVGFLALRLSLAPLGSTLGQWVNDPLIGAPFAARMRGLFAALAHYVAHVVAPHDLCPDYGYASIVPHAWLDAFTLAGVALVAIALVAAALAWKRAPRLFDALLGFAASYVVMSHLLVAASAIVADRVFFFPSFWLVTVVALAIEPAVSARPSLRRLAAVVAGISVAAQALLTARAAASWRDGRTLFAQAVRACPTNVKARMNLAFEEARAGRGDEAAWQRLVGCVIYRRSPAPVAPDLVDGAWEARPLAERAELLRRAVGPEELARAAVAARAGCHPKEWTLGVPLSLSSDE